MNMPGFTADDRSMQWLIITRRLQLKCKRAQQCTHNCSATLVPLFVAFLLLYRIWGSVVLQKVALQCVRE